MKKTIITTLALTAIAFGSAAQTSKNVVIIDNEGQKYEYKGEDVDGVIFQDAPVYIDLTHYLGGLYEEKSTVGNYKVEFGTGEADENGLPLNIGDVQVQLVLSGSWSDVVSEPKLPAGYYRIGNGTQMGTFDVNNSAVWVRSEEGPDGVSPLAIVDGTIDVRTTDNVKYDIRMELTTLAGQFDFRYVGDVIISAGMSEFVPFDEDVNIEFQGGQGRFWSNWYYPFASDLGLMFYQGTVENGVFVNGYLLHVTSIYEPKVEDEKNKNQRLADGVYTVEKREDVKNTFLPFRYDSGKKVNFMGQEMIIGTRLEYYAPDGSRKLGLIKDGTITVSGNGSKFVFDLTTEEGIKVTGSYNHAPLIEYYCDNEEKAPKRPYSTITGDHTLSWKPGTVALSFNDGHSILDDANTLVFMICRPQLDAGQYLQFEVLSNDKVMSDGTYEVNWSVKAPSVLPGVVDFSRLPQFSWYGDLDTTDDEGYQTDLACISSGTITISSAEGDSKHIVFNLVDDAGNKITGEFNGPITDVSVDEDAMAAIRKAKAHTKVRVQRK